MKIETGYLYHIKDDFFSLVNDSKLMANHEYGKKRPTYFTFVEDEILWFVPLSSKIEKYKKIINNKIEKYGKCNTILIRNILGKETAILLQNTFPTLEKYIDHIHTRKGKPYKVPNDLKDEILYNFKKKIKLKKKGYNLFLTDIDNILNIINKQLVTN